MQAFSPVADLGFHAYGAGVRLPPAAAVEAPFDFLLLSCCCLVVSVCVVIVCAVVVLLFPCWFLCGKWCCWLSFFVTVGGVLFGAWLFRVVGCRSLLLAVCWLVLFVVLCCWWFVVFVVVVVCWSALYITIF